MHRGVGLASPVRDSRRGDTRRHVRRVRGLVGRRHPRHHHLDPGFRLLDVLVPAFETASGYAVKTVAVGSGAALKLGEEGNADVLMVNSPAAEKTFVEGGFGINRQLLMHNMLLVVGPPDDPAGISGMTRAKHAFTKIAGQLLGALADECAAIALAAIRRLGLARLDVPVVLSGDVARGAGDLLVHAVGDRVAPTAPLARVHIPEAPPVFGAALMALDRVAPGDQRAVARARASITHEALIAGG